MLSRLTRRDMIRTGLTAAGIWAAGAAARPLAAAAAEAAAGAAKCSFHLGMGNRSRNSTQIARGQKMKIVSELSGAMVFVRVHHGICTMI